MEIREHTAVEIPNTQVEVEALRNSPATDQLDPRLLSALGEAAPEQVQYGQPIHDHIAKRWTPILINGIGVDLKENIYNNNKIPSNCTYLQAPKLNAEIAAAVNESTKGRDRRIELNQQQLGTSLAIMGHAMTMLLGDEDKIHIIQKLSECGRLLCDLHHEETEGRKKLITPNLDKHFALVHGKVNRDEFLFGEDLGEKIKTAKVIEKSGLQLKKPTPQPNQQRRIPLANNTTHLNMTGPPRHAAARATSRGGPRQQRGTTRRAPTQTNRRVPQGGQYNRNRTNRGHY